MSAEPPAFGESLRLPVLGRLQLADRSWVVDAGTFAGGFDCRTRAGTWSVKKSETHAIVSHDEHKPTEWRLEEVLVDSAAIALLTDEAKAELEDDDAGEAFALNDIDEALFGDEAATGLLTTPEGHAVYAVRVAGDGPCEVAIGYRGDDAVALIIPL